jgi:pyruvate kinase
MHAGTHVLAADAVADVANLVLDGADGIVLGSETFRGKFAVACADTVLAICRQVRPAQQYVLVLASAR